jgi:hypothetical protein
MKPWSALFGAVLILAGGGAIAADKVELGSTWPRGDVKMKNVDSRMLSINEAAGKKGTLVVFSCNHCPFVKAWEKRIVAIGNDSQGKGIGVILIDANDPVEIPADDFEHMKQQATAAGYAFPYVANESSDMAAAFGATRTPEVFLFDADRKLVYHGAVDDNAHAPDKVEKRYLKDAVDALLAGQQIKVKETAAVGCGIKFRKPQETGSR